MMLKYYLLAGLLSLSFNTFAQDWQQVKQEQGIKLYTRLIPNSDYKAFKGTMRITGSLKMVLALINNAEKCADWQYRCLEMRVLSDNYIYKLSELPWPLQNRYTVMKQQAEWSNHQQRYTLNLQNIAREQLPTAIRGQLPNDHDNVQMRHSDGYWQFDLQPQNIIDITYQMHGDPAGIIPASLANQGVINAGFETLLNLRRLCCEIPLTQPSPEGEGF
mgnify:CR=1 FL=1